MNEQGWSQQAVEDIMKEIRKRAAMDMEFRQRVLQEPKSVVEELSGLSLPDEFAIEVIEQKPGMDCTFVLPALKEASLTDEELDSLASGGRGDRDSSAETGFSFSNDY